MTTKEEKEINKKSFLIESKCLDIGKLVAEVRQEAEEIRTILVNGVKE